MDLTSKETEVLVDVLDIFEKQFSKDEGAITEVQGYDKEYIDIMVDFADESSEQMQLERPLLVSGQSPKEIASEIS